MDASSVKAMRSGIAALATGAVIAACQPTVVNPVGAALLVATWMEMVPAFGEVTVTCSGLVGFAPAPTGSVVAEPPAGTVMVTPLPPDASSYAPISQAAPWGRATPR